MLFLYLYWSDLASCLSKFQTHRYLHHHFYNYQNFGKYFFSFYAEAFTFEARPSQDSSNWQYLYYPNYDRPSLLASSRLIHFLTNSLYCFILIITQLLGVNHHVFFLLLNQYTLILFWGEVIYILSERSWLRSLTTPNDYSFS